MHLTVDLFCVSYPKDYPWLTYLFRSIARNVVGARQLILVLEEDDPEPTEQLVELAGFPYLVMRCRRYRGSEDCGGMTGQQIEKYRAWAYTNADRIVFLDSDTVWWRKVDFSQELSLDRPLIVYSPWHKVPPHWVETTEGPRSASPQKWFEPTREILGFVPPAETMRQPPYVYPGWFLHKLWEHVGGEERLKSWPHPCEFNCMGNYAMVKHPECFALSEQDPSKPPETPMINFWSHNGTAHPKVRELLRSVGLDK